MTEFLDVIDERDQVIGRADRADVHTRGLLHRGAHVLLFDGEGRLVVQKRSADRKQYASLLDCSVSEHVQAGESYLQAAQRGLAEELGVSGVELRQVFKFRLTYGPNDEEVSVVFEGRANPLRVQVDASEVSEVRYVREQDVLESMSQRPQEFCGWFIQIMRHRAGQPVEIKIL